MELIFRRAREEDLPRVFALWHAGFHVEQGIPDDTPEDFLRREPTVWVAEETGSLLGAVAAWYEGPVFHMGRLAIDAAARGKHAATGLVRHAMADVFAHGVEEVYTESRDITVRILLAMGGRVAGETREFFGDNLTPVTLRREDFEAAAK